ncbi:substrate-binding domain-containing protein [Flavobacterium hankyongi]|uniref:Substrate-binding domain-containing protein n=2 Tax=Flavobacteriaceae TaxID=49546 RepID=A0ABP8ZJN6_9FLAO
MHSFGLYDFSKNLNMKKIHFLLVVVVSALIIFSCNQKKDTDKKDTILTGSVSILVDETILPIIEDQVMVFENQYDAKIKLVGKSEMEIVKLLSEGKYDLAILTRSLSPGEAKVFDEKKIKPKETLLAMDAVAFIANKSDGDIKIDLNDISAFMQEKDQSKFAGLVFDNANSSTVAYMKKVAGVQQLPKEKIYSFNNNNEVIEFVSKNKGMIGVVGVNWISQPLPEFQSIVDKVSVLEVKAKNGNFVQPTQDQIGRQTYPATRVIKMLNYQGYSGLGMGFASFVAGEIGQRIILKSGLVPMRMPSRNIIVRKEIEKK